MTGNSGRLRSSLVIILGVLALAGCGVASAGTPADPPSPTATSLSTTNSVLSGSSFTMPSTVPAGTHDFVFSTPDPNGHTVLLVSLHHGVPLNQFLADMWSSHSAKTPADTVPFARRAEGEADNIGGAMVSADGPAQFTTVLQPGDYDLIDFNGAGLAEPHPVVREFHATGAVQPAQVLPAPDAVIVSYSEKGQGKYVISGTLRAHGTFLYANQAYCPQETALFRVKPGTTAQDITTYFQNAFGGTGKQVRAPFTSGPHGIPGMESGHMGTFTLSVPPGEYVLVSYVVDLRNGLRAAAEGMFQLVTLR